jgi:acetyltransferase
VVLLEKASSGQVALRRLEPSDRDGLRQFYRSLTPETIYRRFLSPVVRLEQLERLGLRDLDGDSHQAVVAVVDGAIVGVARYTPEKERREFADLGVVVADAWQRQGIGTRLLALLADEARRAGVRAFTVLTLADNQAAVRLLRRVVPETKLRVASGVLEGVVPLEAA